MDCKHSTTELLRLLRSPFFAFYTHCCGAAGPGIVTLSREGLLDTHLVLGERCAASDCCLVSFLISFVFTILSWIFTWPCRAETSLSNVLRTI